MTPVSFHTPSRSGPSHWGQSSPRAAGESASNDTTKGNTPRIAKHLK
ncbi:hypothetical protein FRUB_07597 [Fimbriiglobus ruber]|uniref:Uncharacterized protein n=1 Tax=Fimbriiglobus ruber TaxID=1908690 RepID=A0A225DQM6_9BACT|nr:hypothetical protein FRUB_07597 [Fimbriiglobus ruber]